MRWNFILIPLFTVGVATLGSRFTSASLNTWYRAIRLPSWTPAGAVIGTVWTILFILATASALIVWNRFPRNARFRWIIVLLVTNGILNAVWSWLFFQVHALGAAIFEAAALGLSVLALIISMWSFSRKAAYLLIPYLLWVSFATYLTFVVWRLNS